MPIRTKKVKKSQFCKLKKHSRRRLHRRHSSRRYGGSLRKKLHSRRIKRRGGGIIPSGISQIGYSVMGAGQSMADGWNGKSSSFSYVNPSPEIQHPVNVGMYQSNHGIL
jgi:hypothetical protein